MVFRLRMMLAATVLAAAFAAGGQDAGTAGTAEDIPAPAELVSPVPDAGGVGRTVFLLPLEGPIDKSMMMIFRRAFKLARAAKPAAIILDVDTPGGALRETKEIGAWLLSQDIPVYTFVNTEALSAGAILSFATDEIFMHPSATIGSALPILLSPGGGVSEVPENVEEKILSATRALVRAYAQQKGHNEELAAAMVDPSLEVKVGDRMICPAGKLLNLTAKEASELIPPRTSPLLARAIVKDHAELLAAVGLSGATVVRFEAEPAEEIARFIVGLGPILFTLGILGIFIELKTPGFGVPGIAGLILLGIFFFGHFVAGLAGMEEVALVAVGVLLLALEVFVIPGFGITGVAGILLISVGTVMAMVPYLPKLLPTDLPEGIGGSGVLMYIEYALMKFVISLALIFAGGWLICLLLPRTSIYGRAVLTKSLTQASGFVSHDAAAERFLGRTGVAATMLRPSGIVMIADERVDVVTTGELIEKGTAVKVVEVGAGRVVVEPAANGGAGGKGYTPWSAGA